MPDELKPLSPKPYNPLETRRIAESIVRELLERAAEPLPLAEPVLGAGIYAIYYRGDFELYRPVADQNRLVWSQPIYVGQAAPPGGRKARLTDEPPPTKALASRLGQHASSLLLAQNVKAEDFACRYLVVLDVWINLAEVLMIERFQPVWNVVVDGFGNHDPGRGRHQGQCPMWDTLHPGRPWAARLQPNALTAEEIAGRVREHFARTVEQH